ncbi:MAG: methylated-DNA--[protein]-cysteine S-methyltransferase [Flavobacteriaceae bacterium]|nr:methylated-DNA--[protein]-cysteine S-methyltransferase [Flavobacteriaceae bacterium]
MKLYSKLIKTPLGIIKAFANDDYLLALDFIDSKYFDKNIPSNFSQQGNGILKLTEKELTLYFKGELKKFSIPLQFSGTEFQKMIWSDLMKIPYGHTISYQQQAENIGNLKAIRAVANANSKNKIVIIVPCHRVIGKSQQLTGYAGGLDRKAFLLNLEKNHFQ